MGPVWRPPAFRPACRCARRLACRCARPLAASRALNSARSGAVSRITSIKLPTLSRPVAGRTSPKRASCRSKAAIHRAFRSIVLFCRAPRHIAAPARPMAWPNLACVAGFRYVPSFIRMESGSWSKAGAASAPGATLGAADILDGEIEMAEPVTYSQPSSSQVRSRFGRSSWSQVRAAGGRVHRAEMTAAWKRLASASLPSAIRCSAASHRIHR